MIEIIFFIECLVHRFSCFMYNTEQINATIDQRLFFDYINNMLMALYVCIVASAYVAGYVSLHCIALVILFFDHVFVNTCKRSLCTFCATEFWTHYRVVECSELNNDSMDSSNGMWASTSIKNRLVGTVNRCSIVFFIISRKLFS